MLADGTYRGIGSRKRLRDRPARCFLLLDVKPFRGPSREGMPRRGEAGRRAARSRIDAQANHGRAIKYDG